MIHAVAIKFEDVIYTLPRPCRHHHVIQYMAREVGLKIPIIGVQGFITDNGKFLDRREGAKYVLDNKQIDKLETPPRLFSEDLW